MNPRECPALDAGSLHYLNASDVTKMFLRDGNYVWTGVCVFCKQRVSSREDRLLSWETVPTEAHHRVLPQGMWLCNTTNMDHHPMFIVGQNRGDRDYYLCTDCGLELRHFEFTDELTGEMTNVFLSDITIIEEEEPWLSQHS